MPLYEYECEACAHRFELILKFSDPPVETCPKCGGHVRKLISSPAFHLKGTGWYATDYAKKDSGGGSAAKEAAAASSDAAKNEKAEKSSDKAEKSSSSTEASKSAPADSSSSSGSTTKS